MNSPAIEETSAVCLPGARGIDERFHPCALAIASAVLLACAFPPVDRGYLAWCALVPFFTMIASGRRARTLYLSAWAGGFVCGLLTLWWIHKTSIPGMVLMALFMSCWWPIFLFGARATTRRLGVPALVVAPMLWLALEYSRSLIFSGFPWYYLAHSQYLYLPIIQVSDLAGAWGLSLVMAFANACWAEALVRIASVANIWDPRGTLARLALPLVMIASIAGYGYSRIGASRFAAGPTVALLQTDFPQELGNGPKMDVVFASIDRLFGLTLKTAKRPDLIVWPETMYPVGIVKVDPGLSESEFARLALQVDPESTPRDWRDRGARGRADMEMLTKASNTPMVVGTATYDFLRNGVERYNSAILFRPGSPEFESYHKQALVPFGEYVPLIRAIPFLLALTPYRDGYIPSLSPGDGPRVFDIHGTKYAPVICFEDTLPSLVRGFFTTSVETPPDVLVNLTNDGWFRGTSEHQVHLAISTFRAVECRVPIVRAVNTGISAVIDGNGRILASLPAASSSVLTYQVPLDPRTSLYIRGGDWLPIGCLVVSVILVVLRFAWNRQSSTLAHPASVR